MKTIDDIKNEVTALQPTLTAVQEALATIQADLQTLQDGVTPTPSIPQITVPLNTPVEFVAE